MWNINVFSFGDCDHDDFFDLQRWERIYDDDPLEVHPAFEDYDTLLARKDDLIIAAKRIIHMINILEKYDNSLVDAVSWENAFNYFRNNKDQITKIEDKIKEWDYDFEKFCLSRYHE